MEWQTARWAESCSSTFSWQEATCVCLGGLGKKWWAAALFVICWWLCVCFCVCSILKEQTVIVGTFFLFIFSVRQDKLLLIQRIGALMSLRQHHSAKAILFQTLCIISSYSLLSVQLHQDLTQVSKQELASCCRLNGPVYRQCRVQAGYISFRSLADCLLLEGSGKGHRLLCTSWVTLTSLR